MSPAVIVILAAVAALLALRWRLAYRSPALVRQMRQLVEDGAVLLDVRTQAEFQRGGLRGARNIPVQSLQSRVGEITGRAKPTRRRRRARADDRPDATKGVVVYCASGMRSRVAARILRSAGCDPVYDLGPMGNWHKD
jgi:rhodanese-related sulfurtransferase